jgi:hypothetical protein
MCPAIDNPAGWKICAFICFLHARNMSAAEIHCELHVVYCQNVMCEGTVRQWCRMFKAGWINVHKEEWRGWSFVVCDDLVQSAKQTICERRCFKISELTCEFPQTSDTLLYKTITVRLGYHKFCARWVIKILTGTHKTQRMALVLTILEQYHKDSDEFLSQIIWVTGDETWVRKCTVSQRQLGRPNGNPENGCYWGYSKVVHDQNCDLHRSVMLSKWQNSLDRLWEERRHLRVFVHWPVWIEIILRDYPPIHD